MICNGRFWYLDQSTTTVFKLFRFLKHPPSLVFVYGESRHLDFSSLDPILYVFALFELSVHSPTHFKQILPLLGRYPHRTQNPVSRSNDNISPPVCSQIISWQKISTGKAIVTYFSLHHLPYSHFIVQLTLSFCIVIVTHNGDSAVPPKVFSSMLLQLPTQAHQGLVPPRTSAEDL